VLNENDTHMRQPRRRWISERPVASAPDIPSGWSS